MLLRSTLFRPPTVATLLKRDELSAATGRLAQSTSQLAAIRLPHHLVQMPKGLPTRRARTRVQVAIEAVRQSDEYSDFVRSLSHRPTIVAKSAYLEHPASAPVPALRTCYETSRDLSVVSAADDRFSLFILFSTPCPMSSNGPGRTSRSWSRS